VIKIWQKTNEKLCVVSLFDQLKFDQLKSWFGYQVLASVQVERLVIPTIADLVDTWRRSFSVMPMEPQFREEIKWLSLVVITGTTLLCKPIALQHQPSLRKGTGTSQ
jgi:hypothetical protein